MPTQPKKKRKNLKSFVLDTNILLHATESIDIMENNNVVIPITVIEELDEQKKRNDQIGMNARTISRKIDAYSEAGEKKKQAVKTGVDLPNGGKLFVISNRSPWSEVPDLEEKNDNKIILTAHWLTKQSKAKWGKVILLSKDTNVRIKAKSCGVNSNDYMHDKAIKSVSEIYTGIIRVDVPEQYATSILQLLPSNGRIPVTEIPELVDSYNFNPNQCIIFDYKGKTVLGIYKKKAGEIRNVEKPKIHITNGNGKKGENGTHVEPRNTEQAFAMALLRDTSIQLLSFVGKAGTGKTFLALNEMLLSLFERGMDRILVWRPMVELDQGIGFLPGSLEEKMSPWAEPIIENIRALYGKRFRTIIEQSHLEIMPITFAQGSTKHRTWILIDEAQNITPSNIKMLIERAGENTCIILTGDPYQVKHHYLDAISNGLSHVVETMANQEITASIMLTKGERSVLAELAAEML